MICLSVYFSILSMIKVYFDDLREPPDDTWVVIRDIATFQDYVVKNGVPKFISFDHDLGGDERAIDAIKWMIEKELEIYQWQIHSANPVGAENMKSLLNCWQTFYRENLKLPEKSDYKSLNSTTL